MAPHDYALEPNAMFSPDLKWLIFRSNRSGANQVYAVELAKPPQTESKPLPTAP
jgi:oligogalacturonide lyase